MNQIEEPTILTFPVNDFVADQYEEVDESCETIAFPGAKTDSVPENDGSPFYDDLAALANKYIKRFFDNKTAYYGGRIDRRIISRHFYTDLVLNTTVEDAISDIYRYWNPGQSVSLKNVLTDKPGRLPTDIEAVMAVLADCASHGIPKCFAGGIVKMYFELCEGFDFDSISENYSNVA